MTTQLIPVVSAVVGHQTVQTVDGRTLHTFLEVKTEFKNWIVRRIEEYGFIDGEDFRSFLTETSKGSTGGRPTKEYALTLNMGKELAMVEKTAKGKQARQYFIECERRALANPQPPANTTALAAQLAELLQDKVLVDYHDLTQLANISFQMRHLVGLADHYATQLEAQIGKPLINRGGSDPVAPIHAPLTPYEADMPQARKLLKLLHEAGPDGLTMSEIHYKTRDLMREERAALVEALERAGRVVTRQEPARDGGQRPVTRVFVAMPFVQGGAQ